MSMGRRAVPRRNTMPSSAAPAKAAAKAGRQRTLHGTRTSCLRRAASTSCLMRAGAATGGRDRTAWSIAESAAKGIKPLVHNFYRAGDVWPEDWIWNTVDEAAAMLHDGYDSAGYRRYIEEHYSLEHMMRGINEACALDSS